MKTIKNPASHYGARFLGGYRRVSNWQWDWKSNQARKGKWAKIKTDKETKTIHYTTRHSSPKSMVSDFWKCWTSKTSLVYINQEHHQGKEQIIQSICLIRQRFSLLFSVGKKKRIKGKIFTFWHEELKETTETREGNPGCSGNWSAKIIRWKLILKTSSLPAKNIQSSFPRGLTRSRNKHNHKNRRVKGWKWVDEVIYDRERRGNHWMKNREGKKTFFFLNKDFFV